MNKILYLLALVLCSLIFAQDLRIQGKIENTNHQLISNADVYLYDQQNQIVKATISKEGLFSFENLPSQTYYLQIELGDSVQKEVSFFLSENRNIQVLFKNKETTIQEITISGKKKTYQVQKGNINIDIANSSLNKVATTSDLLSKLPFLQLSQNGESLSMMGKGTPLLYLDNQKVDFSMLTSLAVDDIKSVEIIRNPSAKYEAEGKAVVKIILKNSKKEGSKFSIMETMTFNKRFSNNLSANFQQKKNKTEWKLNAAYNQINHWESNGFEYSVPTKNIQSDYIITSVTKRPQLVFGANLYQELNDDGDYVTLILNANLRPDKGDNNTITNYSENGKTSKIKTLNQQDRNRATVNSILNYNKVLKSLDASIFTGLQFTRESNIVDYNFYNDVDNSGYQFSQFRNQNYGVNAYSGRVDIEKKLKNDYTVEFGGSFTKAEAITDNRTDFATKTNPEIFEYFFKEHNWASYAQFLGEKEKLSFSGGIRMETTSADGFDKIKNQTTISRNYVDWFPNAEITYKPNKDYNYTLSFSKTISRPNYGNLASGGLYGSPYVEYVGNPDLLPTYTNTLSANVKLKNWSVNASYYQGKNPIGYNLVYDENRNISKFTSLNFDKESGVSLGLDAPFEYKIWSSQNSLSVNYSKTEDSLAQVKKSTPYLYWYTNNTLKLGKGYNFLIDASWITDRTEGIFDYNAMFLVNFGLTKSISNFDFTLRYNDIFQQNNFVQKLNYDKIITKGSFYGNTPTVSLGIKYNLGKVSNSGYKEKSVNETVNRI